MDDYDEFDYPEYDAPIQEQHNSHHGAISVGGGIILIFLVWFFFFRVDYKKPWINENDTKYSTVVWCKNGNCLSSEHAYVLNVLNEGKAAFQDDRYILMIYWQNGGETEVNAYCDKNNNKLISHDRFCEGVSEVGEIYRFYPLD